MAQLNLSSFRRKLAEQLPKNAKCNKASQLLAKNAFAQLKNEAILDFENNEVTQELVKIGAMNPEQKRDYSGQFVDVGNLYTFIGFDYDPINLLRQMLQAEIRFTPNPISRKFNNNKLSFGYRAYVPSEGIIASYSPMPWGHGQSWVLGLEKTGISGLNQYIYWKIIEASRSGAGFQNKKPWEIRSASFTPIGEDKFVTGIIKNFRRKIEATNE